MDRKTLHDSVGESLTPVETAWIVLQEYREASSDIAARTSRVIDFASDLVKDSPAFDDEIGSFNCAVKTKTLVLDDEYGLIGLPKRDGSQLGCEVSIETEHISGEVSASFTYAWIPEAKLDEWLDCTEAEPPKLFWGDPRNARDYEIVGREETTPLTGDRMTSVVLRGAFEDSIDQESLVCAAEDLQVLSDKLTACEASVRLLSTFTQRNAVKTTVARLVILSDDDPFFDLTAGQEAFVDRSDSESPRTKWGEDIVDLLGAVEGIQDRTLAFDHRRQYLVGHVLRQIREEQSMDVLETAELYHVIDRAIKLGYEFHANEVEGKIVEPTT